MFLVIAGGGKVGYYLAKELSSSDHEVLLIEKDGKKCRQISAELGEIVLQGDAAETSVLAQAGCNRADVVVAVTGDDEDNLVICQVAKRRFNPNLRTIARINNPKNQEIFRLLGIDEAVSSTEVILSTIEAAIPPHPLVPLLKLRRADVEIVEASLDSTYLCVGRRVRDIGLPPDSSIVAIIRNSTAIIPDGSTVLETGDEIIAITRSNQEANLRQVLCASRS